MMNATFSPPHPIVFVFDFSNDAMTVPEFVHGRLTASNESCVSVMTIADVDGDVTVGLAPSASELPAGKREVYRGSLRTPGKKLAIVTSQNEKLVEIDVDSDCTGIVITVDDEQHPSEVWVAAEAPQGAKASC
jgi:hypothetical protein